MNNTDKYWNRAPVNTALAVLNVVFFILTELNGGTDSAANMVKWGAAYTPFILGRHEYWRLLTAAFLHFGLTHLSNNMLVLLVLGDNLETALGHVRYLIFYLACGIAGNAFSMYMSLNGPDYAVGAGASGAIFGIIGGLLFAVIINRGRFGNLSTGRLLVMLGFSLYYGFTTTGVDNAAHIGGLIAGFFLCALMYRRPRGD